MTRDSRGQRIHTQVRLATAGVENLRPADLIEELLDGGVLLVDVREPEEFATGTIGGATNVPRGVVDFIADPDGPHHRPDLDPTCRVVLVCDTGARSALTVHTLYALGYVDVAHLAGGLAAWVADGHTLT